MMLRHSFFIALFLGTAFVVQAEPFRLRGEPFRPAPNVEVVWSTQTNYLPSGLWVYKVMPQTFPAVVLSNLMAIGNFTKENVIKPPRPPVPDKNFVRFQDKSDPTKTRYLNIAPTLGWIEYYAEQDANEPVKDLPSKEHAEQLALDCLFQLGIDRALLCHKKTGYDAVRGKLSREGQKLTEEVFERGVSYSRQIDGIETRGFRFIIHFRNGGKIKDFSLSWRNLSPHEAYRVATTNQIVEMIKLGRAAIPPQPELPFSIAEIEKLSVVKISLFYYDNIGNEPLDFSFPYADLEVIAKGRGTNTGKLFLTSPVLGEKIR